MSPNNVLFLTLKTFSLTGGIEKVCRSTAYTLQQLHVQQIINFRMISFYDVVPDKNYIDPKLFSGQEKNRFKTFVKAFKEGLKSDIVILSHINLAPVGLAIKLIKPKTKLILWTHGIEVWRPINFIKQLFFKKVDQVISVSNFTANSLVQWHKVAKNKIKVIPNALDPFFNAPKLVTTNYLHDKYQIPAGIPVIIALTRLSITEKNKNYDSIIELLGELKQENTPAYYILCGKYDEQEQQRLEGLKLNAKLQKEVILAGFVSDEEITQYYQSAHAFVLPSTKEGFGLVFIEAQACGLQVLAGNQDGSTDAVKNLEAGILVNPQDRKELKEALIKIISNKPSLEEKRAIQEACLKDFGFERFAKDIKKLIE